MLSSKNISKILSLVLVVFLGGVLVTHAYVPLAPLPIGEGGTTPKEYASMGTYLAGMMKLIIALGGVIAIVMAIYGGIARIASGISPSAKADANKRIENALVGLALVLTSYLILNSINPNLVNINFNLPKLEGTHRAATSTMVTTNETLTVDCGGFWITVAKLIDDSGTLSQTECAKGRELALADPIVKSLSSTAQAAAISLKEKYPSVVFTSGKRNIMDQARVMADNIVSTGNRKWIEKTYAPSSAITKLQDWVDNHPEATSSTDITNGLFLAMQTMPLAEQALISKHLSGDAFDIQPSSDGNMLNTIKSLPGLTKFIENESGVYVWHAQF